MFLSFLFLLCIFHLHLALENGSHEEDAILTQLNELRSTMRQVFQLEQDIQSLQSFRRETKDMQREDVLIDINTVDHVPYVVYYQGECYTMTDAGEGQKMEEHDCIFFYREYKGLITLYSDMQSKLPDPQYSILISTHGMIYEINSQRKKWENALNVIKGEYRDFSTTEFLLVQEVEQSLLLKAYMNFFL